MFTTDKKNETGSLDISIEEETSFGIPNFDPNFETDSPLRLNHNQNQSTENKIESLVSQSINLDKNNKFITDSNGESEKNEKNDFKDCYREDESLLNIPDFIPSGSPNQSDFDKENEDESFTDLSEIWKDSKQSYPSIWFNWIFLLAAAVLTAFFGFYIFCQAINTVALAQTMPNWAKYIFLPPLAICGLLIVIVFFRLIWSWYSLNKFVQVSFDELKTMSMRQETRKEATHYSKKARKILKGYLDTYPFHLIEKGRFPINSDKLKDLTQSRDFLLNLNTSTNNWIDKFNDSFLTQLDVIVSDKIKKQAVKAALAIIASPLRILDAIIVLCLSLELLKDMCKIYNLRLGGLALPVLFVKVIRNAFIGEVASQLTDELPNIFGTTIGSSFFKLAGAKITEGGINALFMFRLGRSAQKLLRPLSVTKK
jgi:uncharacterized membrane protein YcjF (UPF0283 family)